MKEQFNKLWEHHAPSQDKVEYFLFLNFVKNYLSMQGVNNPLVVEIGVRGVKQSLYYKNLLNAEYIGIDIQKKQQDFIICGDSTKKETLEELKKRLNGRMIDLLFIDGWHTYDVVKSDWEMYSPLAKHLVALHDINWKINYYPDDKKVNPNGDVPSVNKLWNELYEQGKSMISFQIPGTFEVIDDQQNKEIYIGDPGIGVVLMDRKELECRWTFEKNKFRHMWGENGRAYPRAKRIGGCSGTTVSK